MRVIKAYWEVAVFLVFLVLFIMPQIVVAANSPNYQIQEDTFSSGGNTQSSSANYQERDALGSIGVGSGASTNKQIESGYITTNDPTLQFVVNTSSINLGSLSTGSTATGTATFSVKNYVSSGYIVTINGNPPTNNGYPLSALATPTASSAGTEQFGINLVANTSPTTFGANPVQVPSSSFSFGAAASGYNTTNLYKYVSGNTIVEATKQSGQTDFTISMIANIANTTPGGQYTTSFNLVVIGTY
jgi:hypothetical protein